MVLSILLLRCPTQRLTLVKEPSRFDYMSDYMSIYELEKKCKNLSALTVAGRSYPWL